MRWMGAALAVVVLGLAGCSASGTGSAASPPPGSSTSGTRSPGSPTTGPPPSACTPARPPVPTDGDATRATTGEDRTFTFEGIERHYLLATPPGHDGAVAAPLLLSFHGFAGTSLGHATTTELPAKGTARGYVVVSPESLSGPKEWNLFGGAGRPDDYAFIEALLDHLQTELCVDADRIYAAGHSNGSAFTGFLGCRPGHRLAAIAMVSATVPGNCEPGVHLSVIAFHGTADQLVPYQGGSVSGGPVQSPAAETSMQSRARQAGCSDTPIEDQPSTSVTRLSYPGCAPGTEVVLYRIEGGPHAWPVPRAAPVAASDVLLDFFDAHRRSP